MITGAARAEAALLVIDAAEGVQENSRRHGYMVSMLGVRQLAVVVNKMDLVGWDRAVYDRIVREYGAFLEQVGIRPSGFIPVSGRGGDNIADRSPNLPWYDGPTVLDALDAFHSEPAPVNQPFRMPVQDVYKFTKQGDDRRIVSGTVDAGSMKVGDQVIFFPSGKRSRVKSIEGFNQAAQTRVEAGQAVGFTLQEQIYITRGEVATLEHEPRPQASTRLRVSLFWLGKEPMVKRKEYLLKLGTARVTARIEEVLRVMDASTLDTAEQRTAVQRHDVAECILKLDRAIACDLAADIPTTSRFVIVDDFEIRGGGIVREALPDRQAGVRDRVLLRNYKWEPSIIQPERRAEKYNQKAALHPGHRRARHRPQGRRQGARGQAVRGRQGGLLPRHRQRALRRGRRHRAQAREPTGAHAAPGRGRQPDARRRHDPGRGGRRAHPGRPRGHQDRRPARLDRDHLGRRHDHDRSRGRPAPAGRGHSGVGGSAQGAPAGQGHHLPPMVSPQLRSAVIELAREAGRATMRYYDGAEDAGVREKDDKSPVTLADEVAHDILVEGLRRIDPATPVVSEEAEAAAFEHRRGWRRFWLVDPLDGTKEFIKRRAEFTVNVALDRGRRAGLRRGARAGARPAVLGGEGRRGLARGEGRHRRSASIRPPRLPGTPLTVVESLSHPSPELEEYLRTIPVARRVKAGSSLKFCWVAEGRADIYPRLGPTMEWDVAAGDCIYRQSGRNGERSSPLTYNKPDLRNPSFVVGL